MGGILVVGSVNMDLVLGVERLPAKGETVVGNSIQYIPGGKGANQAVAAQRLGGKVSFAGKVGQDNFGEQLFEFLHTEKLDLEGLGKSDISSGTALITVDKEGHNTIVVLSGANSEVTPDYIEKHTPLIERSDIVLTQFEIPISAVERLLSISKKESKVTILNPAPAIKVSDNLLSKVDYLVVNETELSFLADSPKVLEQIEDIKKAAQSLHTRSGNIIVTLGSRGVVTFTNGRFIRTEGVQVKAVDTTAAGDCFVGAFAVKLSEKSSLEEALSFANKAAALSVQKLGASNSLPYSGDIS